MCYAPASTHDDRTNNRDDQEWEPKLYAKTLVPLVPDHPEDGPGIPAGVEIEVTDENGRLLAHYHDGSEMIHMDVLLSELDTDI